MWPKSSITPWARTELSLDARSSVCKTLLLVLTGVALAGCAVRGEHAKTSPGPALQITGVEIHNSLVYPVQDVTILVPATGEYVSCGQIFPRTSCSTTFPARDYRENPVQLSWKEYGQPRSTKPFTLKAPTGAQEGQAAYIRVEVFAAGQAGANLLLVDPEQP